MKLNSYTGLTKEKKQYEPMLYSEIYRFFLEAPQELQDELTILLEGEKFEEAIELIEDFFNITVPSKTRKQLTYSSEYAEPEKEYEEKLKEITEELGATNVKVKVNFYTKKHKYCPLQFDLFYESGIITLNVYDCDNEEPSNFWEGVTEELKEELKTINSNKNFLPRETPYNMSDKETKKSKYWKYKKAPKIKHIGVLKMDDKKIEKLIKEGKKDKEIINKIIAEETSLNTVEEFTSVIYDTLMQNTQHPQLNLEKVLDQETENNVIEIEVPEGRYKITVEKTEKK